MTNQEIYDAVKAHLLAQGKRAAVSDLPGSSCAYRGQNGTKCAVGCLIPDDEYSPEIEGLSVSSPQPEMSGLMEFLGFTREQREGILSNLQVIHDGRLPSEWPAAL